LLVDLKGFVCIFAFGENYGVTGAEPGEQQSTGLLHLDWFESLPQPHQTKKTPYGCLFCLRKSD